MENKKIQDPKSPPHLVDYNFTSFHFESEDLIRAIEPEDTEEADLLKVDIGYKVFGHSENRHRYKLIFRVKGKTTVHPKTAINVTIAALFAFDEDKELEENYMEYMIRLQGCTTLYGLLRGHIANISALTTKGKLILPNIFMRDIIRDIESKRKADAESEAQQKLLDEPK